LAGSQRTKKKDGGKTQMSLSKGARGQMDRKT
jgi:hypothetical protein